MEPNLKWLRSPKEWLLIQPGIGTGVGGTRGSFLDEVTDKQSLVHKEGACTLQTERMAHADRGWGAQLVRYGYCGPAGDGEW